jgi:hypothetical protein
MDVLCTPSKNMRSAALDPELDDKGVGVRVPVGSGIFPSQRPDQLWAHPVSHSMRTRAAGKAAGEWSAKVKKKWIYAPTRPYIFMTEA